MTTVTDAIARLFRPATARAVVRAALRSHPQIGEIDDAWIERCWPTKAGVIWFEWGLRRTDAHVAFLYGCFGGDPAVTPADPPAVGNGHVRGALTGVSVHLPQWEVRVFSPDCDRSLPQIAACLNPSIVFGESSGLRADSTFSPHDAGARVLAFKPTRRATIAYLPRSPRGRWLAPRFVGKTFFNSRGKDLLLRHRIANEQFRLRRGRRIRTPVPVGFVAPLKLAVFEWAPAGAAATARLNEHDFALALAALHQLDLPGLPSFTCEDECAVVREWCGHLRALSPSDAPQAESLADDLLACARELDEQPPRVIHRDFYDQQLLADGHSLTLLDLDTLARGPAALDIGNAVAHWVLANLLLGRRIDPMTTLASMIDSYQRLAPKVDARAAQWFAASSLIRVGAVHALRTHTRRCTRTLWRHAARLIARLQSTARVCHA